MPSNKDLKRIVRVRMLMTGESYTAARAQVVAKRADTSLDSAANADPTTVANPTPMADPAPDYAAIAGMSDDAVHAKTGRTWAEWATLLDGFDATRKPRREVVRHIHERLGIPVWWAQMVMVSYERFRGLRDKRQRIDGSFEANKSKTFHVPASRLYAAFADAEQRRRWLPGIEVTVRKNTPDKSVRMLWDDGRPVEAYFTAKGDAKSSVAVQHHKLESQDAVDTVKEDWAERFGALAHLLTSNEETNE